ncbi:MAG: di-trans,poly-cis-decaprenylcistransferase [Thaumarchaeota archaeon]|nr:di-trans,poly-cis-decaprenylcistransferase [Nitrososphaerota archaeon]
MLPTLLRWIGAYKIYSRFLRNQINNGHLPQHVGIVLDGNRRWAYSRLFSPSEGHKAGADTAEAVLDWCLSLGIKILTLYVLSTENLQRPNGELQEIIRLIEERLTRLSKDERLWKHKVRVKALGNLELLPGSTRQLLTHIEEITKNYDRHFLNIAIAYGGRAEIIDAIKIIAESVRKGELNVDDVNQKTIEQHLYTSHLPNPEPDLIIRTSGEERMSGFLTWQSAYSELVFLDVDWPDFRKIDLMRAIRTFQKRSRRYGR